jgi:hypothetical protein
MIPWLGCSERVIYGSNALRIGKTTLTGIENSEVMDGADSGVCQCQVIASEEELRVVIIM